LTNLGLGGLSASDEASYVENTVALASDLELLEKLHFTLRNFFEESPLRDERRYTRQVVMLE
jgi:predicted O-linked N-acetylglucosamine transferase (SPINDLY family)